MHRVVGDPEWAAGPEQARDGGALQVGIEHAGRGSPLCERARERRRDIALADAAFATDDGDDVLHVAQSLDDARSLPADLLA
jgi:hypothetical protein